MSYRDLFRNDTYEENGINGLDLLYNTACLVDAHATKLAIALKPPIHEAASAACCDDLSKTLHPLSIAARSSSSRAVREAIRDCAMDMCRAMHDLMHGKERLVAIGILYEACNAAKALKELGAVGIITKKLDEFADLIVDAQEDLTDWLLKHEPVPQSMEADPAQTLHQIRSTLLMVRGIIKRRINLDFSFDAIGTVKEISKEVDEYVACLDEDQYQQAVEARACFMHHAACLSNAAAAVDDEHSAWFRKLNEA